MASRQNQTRPTDASVQEFLDQLTDEQQRQDSQYLVELMSSISGQPATMWGPSIIGFGQYHYTYQSGREGDSPIIGFSPRRGTLSLYVVEDSASYQAELTKLGPHKISKACLYIK